MLRAEAEAAAARERRRRRTIDAWVRFRRLRRGRHRSDFVDDDDLDDVNLHDYAESEDRRIGRGVAGSNPDVGDDATEAWRRKVRDAADAPRRRGGVGRRASDARERGARWSDDADVTVEDDVDFDALVDEIVEEMEAEDAAASSDWNASDPRDRISRRAAAARRPDDFDGDRPTSSRDEFDDEDDDEVDDFDFDKFDEGERAREESLRRRR